MTIIETYYGSIFSGNNGIFNPSVNHEFAGRVFDLCFSIKDTGENKTTQITIKEIDRPAVIAVSFMCAWRLIDMHRSDGSNTWLSGEDFNDVMPYHFHKREDESGLYPIEYTLNSISFVQRFTKKGKYFYCVNESHLEAAAVFIRQASVREEVNKVPRRMVR